ncbi:MAG: sugar phosphate isomerase/epimerase [Planctomycetota bacterium]
MHAFRIGIDSYCLQDLRPSALEVLAWAEAHGAEGVQFSGGAVPAERAGDDGFLSELGAEARARRMYVEWGGGQHLPFDTRTWRPRSIVPLCERAARQARAVGANVVRSCSGGLFRWTDEAPPTEELLAAMTRALPALRPVYEDLGVTLAIEVHFEFTTFELRRMFEACGAEPGGYLGICLDTMNLLTMLEDPVEGTRRILPWVVATHIKDGAVGLGASGLVSFPVEPGAGVVNLGAILDLLATLPRVPNLTLEDHGGSFEIPIFAPAFLRRFPDLTAGELARIVHLVQRNEDRPAAERARPLPREDWPAAGEERVARGIATLRRLAAGRDG